jgi:hypothetical protein
MSPSPIDLSAVAIQFFPGAGAALSSSSTSAIGYNKWFTHYQVLYGMWKRVWMYDDNLATTNGTASGPPAVNFTYLDVNVNTRVLEKIETINWSTGVQVNHELMVSSNSAISGAGTFGTFWTIVAGYWRAPFVTGNTEDNCDHSGPSSWNVKIYKTPGDYQPSTDTRVRWIGEFNSGVTMSVPGYCPRFEPDLIYT